MFRLNPPNAATYFGFSLASLVLAGMVARFALLAVVFAAGAVYFAAEGLRRLREDPYDLKKLREVQEQDELAERQPPRNEGAEASVFCPYCAHVYSSELPTCPQCGRSVNA